MINYNPTHCKYSYEANIRLTTQQNQNARESIKESTRGGIGKP